MLWKDKLNSCLIMFAFCCNIFQRVQKDEFVNVVWFICNSEVVDAWIRKAFFERLLISVTYVCIFICLWYFADPWKIWKLFSLCLKKLLRSLLGDVLCCNVFFREHRRMSLYVYFGFSFWTLEGCGRCESVKRFKREYIDVHLCVYFYGYGIFWSSMLWLQ
jgi:hypothetical protein